MIFIIIILLQLYFNFRSSHIIFTIRYIIFWSYLFKIQILNDFLLLLGCHLWELGLLPLLLKYFLFLCSLILLKLFLIMFDNNKRPLLLRINSSLILKSWEWIPSIKWVLTIGHTSLWIFEYISHLARLIFKHFSSGFNWFFQDELQGLSWLHTF